MDTATIEAKTQPNGKRRRVKIDGGLNLYMNVTPKGARSWVLFLFAGGTTTELGLGRYPDVSYAAARAIALAPDPKAARDAPHMPTFGDAFMEVLRLQEKDWKAQNVVGQVRGWIREMEMHAADLLPMPIDAITPQDVATALNSATNSRTGQRSEVIAQRLRQRMQLVFGWAAAQTPPLRTDNPAVLDTQKFLAQKIKPKHEHHAACPHERIAELLAALPEGVAAECARFVTLTGVRVNEAAGARWEEFDLKKGLWTIPPERMKAKVRHLVPLSQQALAVLHRMRPQPSGHVFPGSRGNPHVVPNVIRKVLRRPVLELEIVDPDTGAPATMHGMRSALVDWVVESDLDRHDALASIGHLHGTVQDRAYLRTGAWRRRRTLMRKWGEYVTGGPLASAVADAGETGEARRPEPKRSGVFDIATQTHR